ncbi:MAG: hypothetical protein LJE67_00040, partial [Salaquimonas sp.]|nr:hypothetical protein [Salaquimonas sp.]
MKASWRPPGAVEKGYLMPSTYKIAIATALIAATAVASAFADEIGRVRVDGSVVILHDDNTWEYAGKKAVAPGNCTRISSEVLPVSVCLDPDNWQLGNLSGAYEHSFYNKQHDMYVGLITEKQVIELDAFKKAILTNAQSAAKLNKVKTL